VRDGVTFLFESKFYLLFSFLFGYSFTIQLDSAARKGVPFGRRFGRRLIGLAALGLAHGLLFFSGDILMIYAIAGCLLFLVRDWSPRRALIVAGCLLVLTSSVWAVLGLGAVEDPEPFRSDPVELERQAEELEAGYASGDIGEVIDTRTGDLGETFFLLLLIQGPSALAMFLIGLAAGKVRALHRPEAFTRLWKRLFAFGLLFGLPAAAFYAWSGGDSALHPARELFGLSVDVLLAPALTGAYLSAFVLARDTRPGSWLIERLAPAGRIALTNYLLQSIVLSLIFTGYGLALIGQVSPGVAVLLATGVFVIQTAISAIWLKRYRYGPAEWILRAFTNWSWPAWKAAGR
jgi:uncharacterized protein